MQRTIFLLLTVFLILGACGQPGDLPLAIDPNPVRKGLYYNVSGKEQFRPVNVICYIDTDRHNPLNAADYTIKDSGLPFFDYVILGGAFFMLDEKGYYIHFSNSLKTLLAQRKKYITPLRKRGIKVLLGLKSTGAAAFGHLDDDKMYVFCEVLYKALKVHGLDGVEFFDDADDSAYPDIGDYYDGRDEFKNADEWLAEQWVQGGKYFNNVFYVLRETFFKFAPQGLPDETRRRMWEEPALFVRESKFGRILPNRFYISSGYADFTGSSSEITASINPFFDRFPPYSSLIANTTTEYQAVLDIIDQDNTNPDASWMPQAQYAPLSIDLDGGAKRNVFYQYMTDADEFENHRQGTDVELADLYTRFKGDRPGQLKDQGPYWEYVFFNNLKSIDEAEEDYYRWVGFNPNLPPSEFGDPNNWNYEEDGEWNPKYVPLPFVFDELVRVLFNDRIVCSGGNHKKDW